MANTLMVIFPYRHNGIWVFDDEAKGLVREPFVAGIPEMIDEAVKPIPDAKNGFRLMFSATPFPGYQFVLTHTRTEMSGNWYTPEGLQGVKHEGWLCPALFQYFDNAPEKIYLSVGPIEK